MGRSKDKNKKNKRLPMNKIKVGAAPSPNLFDVTSKVGSLDNAKYKPGGGGIKIFDDKYYIKEKPPTQAKQREKNPQLPERSPSRRLPPGPNDQPDLVRMLYYVEYSPPDRKYTKGR